MPFELPVQIAVQLLLELEANWLDQNVNELEFELSKMYMKQPKVSQWVLPHFFQMVSIFHILNFLSFIDIFKTFLWDSRKHEHSDKFLSEKVSFLCLTPT